jgi:hypothetical protein
MSEFREAPDTAATAPDPDAMPKWLADRLAENKALKRVFIVKGVCRIRQAAVTIKADGKMAWAILPSGQRFLLGATAFFTLASAERCKLAHLTKLAQTRGPAWSNWGAAGETARQQLAEYAATGRVH